VSKPVAQQLFGAKGRGLRHFSGAWRPRAGSPAFDQLRDLISADRVDSLLPFRGAPHLERRG